MSLVIVPYELAWNSINGLRAALTDIKKLTAENVKFSRIRKEGSGTPLFLVPMGQAYFLMKTEWIFDGQISKIFSLTSTITALFRSWRLILALILQCGARSAGQKDLRLSRFIGLSKGPSPEVIFAANWSRIRACLEFHQWATRGKFYFTRR